jgi:glycolate oxidase
MERELYSRDLAPVPSWLVKLLFNALPEIVVRPASTKEISELMKLAWTEHVPVTPRAGATTVFFNTVPVKGGIVMDLNLIKGIVAVDEEQMTVTVRAATTWGELEEYLNQLNYACKSVPSSAPAATIGGWLCMMGYGPGSLKYGSLMSQVKAIEVVLPNGRVQKYSKEMTPSIDRYAASEGTLGIITEIELEIRALTSMKHFLFHVPDIEHALLAIKNFVGRKTIPYNIHFSDAHYMRTMKDLGMAHWDTKCGCLISVDYEGSVEELSAVEADIDMYMKSDTLLTRLPDAVAEKEWDERFRSIRLKRGGPSVLGGEVWMPIKNLPSYMRDLEQMANRYGVELITYGHVVSPEHTTMMTALFADETSALKYMLDLSLVKKIQDAGYRNGGCPYGVGLWNTPYIRRIYNRAGLKRIRERKRTVDPSDIMNPGKIYQTPFMLNAVHFHISMEILAAVRKVFQKGW